MSIGDVLEIFRSETEVRFEWKIWKIFSIPEKVGNCYSSPYVQFSNALWYLKIYPSGVSPESKEWIGIKLVKLNLWKSRRLTLGIRKADGTEEKIVHDQSLHDYQDEYTVTEFLKISDLLSRKSQLAPLDVYTVICAMRCDEQSFVGDVTLVSREILTEDESNTGTRGSEHADLDAKGVCILRKQLKDLLQDGEDRDVTFKVKDREFRAHRDMLRARSPVFAAMFKHEMKESTDDPIDIVDCSPEAFGEFLQYVYTGKVENFSTSTALGLYCAGDKYDVSGLKEICVEYLKTSLSTTVICDVITLAAKYGEKELHELSMAFFSEELEDIMSTKEWQQFLGENHIQANEMCLKAVRNLKTSYIKRE